MHHSVKTAMTIGGILLVVAGCSSSPKPSYPATPKPPTSSILPQAEPSKYVGTYQTVDSGIEYTMRVNENFIHESTVSVEMTAMNQRTYQKKTFTIPVTFHGSNVSGFSIEEKTGDQTSGELRFGNGVLMIIHESYTPFFFEGQKLKFVHSDS